MKREVDAFVGDAPQFDDITMLGLRYSGSGTRDGHTARRAAPPTALHN